MRTLVLNKAWIAIGHVTWKRAFILLCKEAAEILEYYEDTIVTPSTEMFVPAVIRLLNYDKIPSCKVTYNRRCILERDRYECQYCGEYLSNSSATLDHVLPRSRGGKTTFENTVTSCHPCNNNKGDKLLGDIKLELKRKPFRPLKTFFKLRLPSLKDEWKDYLPRKMINEFQIRDRNFR